MRARSTAREVHKKIVVATRENARAEKTEGSSDLPERDKGRTAYRCTTYKWSMTVGYLPEMSAKPPWDMRTSSQSRTHTAVLVRARARTRTANSPTVSPRPTSTRMLPPCSCGEARLWGSRVATGGDGSADWRPPPDSSSLGASAKRNCFEREDAADTTPFASPCGRASEERHCRGTLAAPPTSWSRPGDPSSSSSSASSES